jgi:hypothetical protein
MRLKALEVAPYQAYYATGKRVRPTALVGVEMPPELKVAGSSPAGHTRGVSITGKYLIVSHAQNILYFLQVTHDRSGSGRRSWRPSLLRRSLCRALEVLDGLAVWAHDFHFTSKRDAL